ncbi:uncharacterized protein LOC116321233 isoform X1 [Oreochromis aureus]|uniref:uncharacterized protein LOC116321233 isoform X1 n=1 Tax=Oreochromis aureus TaxID=47969 RepID=UPI001952F87A|nr:uncharacterized protein LOC116321233 isoform X1 [Oreochromis aureus]
MFSRHPDTMKTPCVSLLLGVCVLLLSAPTVSAVSLSVSPNLQQFFRGSSPVYLSCVDDGQTADGWTVKRTRGNLTEDCGAAGSEFSRFNSSFCGLGLSTGGNFLCVSSSGQQSDEVSISVSEGGVILEIPALPVMTGSDATLYCTPKEGERRKSYFIRDDVTLGSGPEGKWILSKVQRSDEGLYSCFTDIHPRSPQSRLRVRVPPKIIHPPPHCPPPPCNSTNVAPPVETPFTHPPCSSPPPAPPPSLLVPVVAGLVSGLLLVLVLGGVLFLCSKLKGGRGADLWSCGGDGCLRRSVCLCFSGLFLLTAAGVCVLLLSALTVSTASPPCESVLRLFCHLVVFSPYCISTGLLLSICWSRRTPNKPAVSMEMIQRDGGGQGLAEDGDDVTADVTTEHAF